MNELAKWIWIVLLMALFFGVWTFVILGAAFVIIGLLWWLKPEWLEKM